MGRTYQIENKGEVTVVKFILQPSYKNFHDAFKEVLDHGQCARYRLWDLSCGFNLSVPEIKNLGLYARSLTDGSPAMVGVIAPDDMSFGLAKMIGGYCGNESIDYQVFRSQYEALRWMSANGIT